jgi:hypothetical protein
MSFVALTPGYRMEQDLHIPSTQDKRFNDQSHPDVAAIWFHIFDGNETDYLYIKWTEYGKPESDFFGLEFTFHQE